MKSYKPIFTMFALLLTMSLGATLAYGQAQHAAVPSAHFAGNGNGAAFNYRLNSQSNAFAQAGVGRTYSLGNNAQLRALPQAREQYQMDPRSGRYNPRFQGNLAGQDNLRMRYPRYADGGIGQSDRFRYGQYGGYRSQSINLGGGYRPGLRPIFGNGLFGYRRYAFGGVYLDFDFCAGPGFVAYPWVYYSGWGGNPWFGYGGYGMRPQIAWGQSFTYMVDETQDVQVVDEDGQPEYDGYNEPIMRPSTVAVAYTAILGPRGYGYYGRNRAWIGINIGRW